MISIRTQEGKFVKAITDFDNELVIGISKFYGWITESTILQRAQKYKKSGYYLAALSTEFLASLKINKVNPTQFKLTSLKNCKIEELEFNRWQVSSDLGVYIISDEPAEFKVVPVPQVTDRFWKWAALLALLFATLLGIIPLPNKTELEAPILDQQVVKITIPEKQKVVKVAEVSMQEIPKNLHKASQETKRAIRDNLGFIGLLGKKDLKKALGGMPTSLKDVSAGAGAGGKEGSGGESLVGLGAGVKKTTVGNTGLAGLGGVGTKGQGGGAGGYGNMMVGSGEGKGLTSLALSKDVVLEGGLDRSVIQATIAKYLNQIKACYETGLRKNNGLSGQVSMGFEINGEGSMNYSKVQNSSLGNPEVESCISNVMMKWKFPKPTGGVNVKVTYPFLLRPTNL